jgi:hypothetical protein
MVFTFALLINPIVFCEKGSDAWTFSVRSTRRKNPVPNLLIISSTHVQSSKPYLQWIKALMISNSVITNVDDGLLFKFGSNL